MLTYNQLVQLDAESSGAHGTQVEGNELECFSRAYMQEDLKRTVKRLSLLVTSSFWTDGYSPERACNAVWFKVVNKAELAYNAPALAPGMPGFKPATKHTIDRDGRMMAAIYMERQHRKEVFRLAGIELPEHLTEDLRDED